MPTDEVPSSTPPSRTQAERRAATEDRLLEAAFSIVADQGVRSVTTAAVGDLAGYSRGIVNHHFGSRGELMVRLAEATQRRFVPSPDGKRGREHVLRVVDDYLSMARTDPRTMRVFQRLWAAAMGDEEPVLREGFTGRDAFFRDYFADAITEGLTDGTIHADVDPRTTAIALVGLIRGIVMQCQVDPALAADETVRTNVLALVDRALSPDPPNNRHQQAPATGQRFGSHQSSRS